MKNPLRSLTAVALVAVAIGLSACSSNAQATSLTQSQKTQVLNQYQAAASGLADARTAAKQATVGAKYMTPTVYAAANKPINDWMTSFSNKLLAEKWPAAVQPYITAEANANLGYVKNFNVYVSTMFNTAKTAENKQALAALKQDAKTAGDAQQKIFAMTNFKPRSCPAGQNAYNAANICF